MKMSIQDYSFDSALPTCLPDLDLPIYNCRLNEQDGYVYYAPGYICRVRGAYKQQFDDMLYHASDDPDVQSLLSFARQAKANWNEIIHTPFEPLGLTLYLNRKCNLYCSYCFADPQPDDDRELSIDAVKAAVNLVVGNCRTRNIPFTLVFHGGGEPTLSFQLIESIMAYSRELTNRLGIRLFSYIATNGVVSKSKAQWMADNFDIIGLSCDGPFPIQTRQRPLINGTSSTPYIQRTASIIQSSGKLLNVRVTLTPESFLDQPLIVKYICEQMHPALIHVEIAYLGGRSQEKQDMSDLQVEEFVESYLAAKGIASQNNTRWMLSGTRPSQIHGAYCNPFRQVLNLIPEGISTTCFKMVNPEQITHSYFRTGYYDAAANQFRLDRKNTSRLGDIYKKPQKCQACFLEYHCTHGCPDICLFNQEESSYSLCEIYRKLAYHSICEEASKLEFSSPESISSGQVYSVLDW